MDIGQRVKELRKGMGMPAAELARRTEVSRNAIVMIEGGQRKPSMDLLERIARELRVEPADLLREEPTLAGKAEAPGTGPMPYEVGEVVASIPYAEGGQAEAFEEAVLAASEARPHMPTHAHLALVDNGERVEVTIEVPADADLSVGTRRIRRRMRRRV